MVNKFKMNKYKRKLQKLSSCVFNRVHRLEKKNKKTWTRVINKATQLIWLNIRQRKNGQRTGAATQTKSALTKTANSMAEAKTNKRQRPKKQTKARPRTSNDLDTGRERDYAPRARTSQKHAFARCLKKHAFARLLRDEIQRL